MMFPYSSLTAVLPIILLGFFIWLLILTFLLWKQLIFYHRLTEGTTKKDLQSTLNKLLTDLVEDSKKIDEVIKTIEAIKKNGLYHVQKVGLVRFNPFEETGGNQSFCLALLDGEDSGLVISSLHSREATRIYAKPVSRGMAAGYDLSAEEQQAVKQAKRIK